jgi:hypothetical protein
VAAPRLLLVACLAASVAGGVACGRDPAWDREIEGARRSDAALAANVAAQRAARGEAEIASPDSVILFGDLHVHTSYSWDGGLFATPMLGGDGAHPPNDACDYARYCSGLDFYALTDHAESMLPENWALSKQSVRQCNAIAGDAASPDLVAFMGFEWSQAGLTPEKHFGHRCVVFPDDDEASLPARPISAEDRAGNYAGMESLFRTGRWFQPPGWRGNNEYIDYLAALQERPQCPDGVPVRELPLDCQEIAPTPRDLHAKLDEWGFDALTIPHGMTWGTYTPATATIDKHLDAAHYDAERMRLVELNSGHGNSEEYRAWREFEIAEDGTRVCRAPTESYLPCCWQAGEIMRARCGDLPSDECERRVALARQYGTEAYTMTGKIFPDAPLEDWLDCGQCRDCFKPAFSTRPRESVQYAMALSQQEEDGSPRRFRYGFIGSSDIHSSRPGTGYKQIDPSRTSDVRGEPPFPMNRFMRRRPSMDEPQLPIRPTGERIGMGNADLRVVSFLYPGGLAAVHSQGRSREAIWHALERREVYATSGPRILLWFDLLNGADGRAPMGSEHRLGVAPRFEVRAVGSFEPKPGCPEESRRALSPERLEGLCGGECHFPSETRRAIAAIEIVRVRPQRSDDEAVGALIEDPWRRFECKGNTGECTVGFEDPEFGDAQRDALYYARALEVESVALNGNPLATEFDADGNAISVTICSTERVSEGGCPAPVQERAWSSPIFVDFAGAL